MHSANDPVLEYDENLNETADIFDDVDFLGDLYTQSTSKEALNARSKFLPKAKKKKPSELSNAPTSLANERDTSISGNAPVNATASTIEAEVPMLGSSVDFMEGEGVEHSSPADPCFIMVQDPENAFPEPESLSPENDIDPVQDHDILDGEETVDFSTFSSLDDTFAQPLSDLACSLGKFPPKLSSRRKDQHLEFVPSERDSFHSDTEPQECSDQMFGFELHVDQSPGENEYLPQPKHAKKVNFQTESPVHGVGDEVIFRNDQETPRKSNRLRKKVQFSMFTSEEDEDACNGQSTNLNPPIDAENQVDDFGCIQETGGHEQTSKNTKTPSDETEKTTRRRKRQTDKHSSGEQAPVKRKFSHSTKRTRRQVNKKLLETPEEEIDVRKLPLKDLIQLTEARERMSVKAGAPEQPQYRSHQQDFGYEPYDEGNDYMEDNDHNIDDEEAIPATQVATTKLNYHTYMKRSYSSRWTKMETDMFYQAIRQFGTDFSMIQQLFPGRTRHQVRLKFKNEERKHPLQIADAISHPSKDYSQFEELIQRLQAQAEEEAGKEDEEDDIAESELQDSADANEEGEMEKLDGEKQDADEMDGYNPTKYDDYEDAFDWDIIKDGHGQSPYTGKDDFGDTYDYN